MLDTMGLAESDMPGYHFRDGEDRMSEEERALLERLEAIREESKRALQIAELRTQIEALEAVSSAGESE